MIVFQLIAVPICLFLCGRSLLAFFRQRQRWGSLVAALLWITATVAILQPELTNLVARTLGIGRGTDLVVYLFAIAFLVSSFHFYRKYRRIESDLTQLVRHLAIEDALERGPQQRNPPRP